MSFLVMPKRRTLLSKFISIFIIQAFILSNIAFAIPKEASVDVTKQPEITLDPEKIVIPREFGLVKSRFTGTPGRLVVHIQDAHCNYEAQANIVKILENLIKNYNLTLVSVEGADGDIDTSWFKAFPDDEVRKEVADYFMRKGEITGPEFLSITSDYPIKLFGAETRNYYIQNLNAFMTGYPLKEAVEKHYSKIKTVINRLKGYIYSDDLKTMDAKMQDYESKKIQFNEYVRFLQEMAQRHKINLRSYDNFFKLVSTLLYEKKIDFNVTDKERSALIDELSKSISKEALTELVAQSLAFKSNKVSSAEYYNYLKALALANGVELGQKYPNLYNYIIYNSVYSRIENEKLFNDIKNIEIAVKEKLFTNEDQRTLEKLSRHIDILLGLVNIKLLNGDFEYYEAHKGEFTEEAFLEFIKKKTIQYGLSYDMEPPSDAISKSIPQLEDFYSIAIKRDNALVDNTLGQMKKSKVQLACLVTGGFHSDGITRLLERQKVSYIVVCPNITKDVPSPYIQILTNQKTPLEEILATPASQAKETKSGLLAVYLISAARELRSSHREALGALQGRVDIAGEFDNKFTRRYVERWIAKAQAFAGSQRLAYDRDILFQAFVLGVDKAIAKHGRAKTNREEIIRLAKAVFDEIYAEKAIPASLLERPSRRPAVERAAYRASAAGVIDDLESLEKPKSIAAYKQGLEAARDILALSAATPAPIHQITKRIFAKMEEQGLPEPDAMPNPELVAIRMEVAERFLLSALTADESQKEKIFIYFDSLINQYIAFVKLFAATLEIGPAVRALFDQRINVAQRFTEPIKRERERSKLLSALSTLYGNETLTNAKVAAGGNEDRAISTLLLDAREGMLRNRVERVIQADIIKGQRSGDAAKDEALALRFMKAVCLRLAELNRTLASFSEGEFEKAFNERFGVLFICLAGGAGSRYGLFTHKAHGNTFTGMDNVDLVLRGAFHAPVKPAENQDSHYVVGSLFSILKYLAEETRLGLMKRDEGAVEKENESRPKTIGMGKVAPEEMDRARSDRFLPAGTYYLRQEVGDLLGYGGSFMVAMQFMIEQQRKGTLPDVPYFMRNDGEQATLQQEDVANVTLIAWMTAVAYDNLVTLGLREDTVIEGKGMPVDEPLLGVVRFLQDWRNLGTTVVQRKLLALLKDIPANADLRKRVESWLDLSDEERGLLIEEIHGDTAIGQRNPMLINANVVVMHKDVARRYFESNFQKLLEHDNLKGQVNDRTGTLEFAPADVTVCIFDDYATNRPGERIPLGYTVVSKGPRAIKNTFVQSEFNTYWQEGIRNILREAGVDISGLHVLTINPGPDVPIFNLGVAKEMLFGKDGVFREAKDGKVKGVKLSGKVHIDLRARIDNGVTLENSYILGSTIVESGSKLTDTTLFNIDVGKGCVLERCYLKDGRSIPANTTLRNQIAVPLSPNLDLHSTTMEDIYRRSSTSGTVPPDEISEVLSGVVPKPVESVLFLEDMDGKAILELIKELREQEQGEPDETVDLQKGGDVDYVVRQIVKNMGLFASPKSMDPHVEGQPLAFPIAARLLPIYCKLPGVEKADTKLVCQIVSMFGKTEIDPKKNRKFRRIHSTHIMGPLKIGNEFIRFGNGVTVDDLEIYGRLYVGDGWGVVKTNIPGYSMVVLGDHLMVLDDDEEVTAYELPSDGDINSLSILKNCEITAERVYIGPGAGEWQVEHRGKVLQNVKIRGNAIVIPEMRVVSYGEVVDETINNPEKKLADALATMTFDDAYNLMLGILAEDSDTLGQYDVTPAGRYTSLATAICFMARAQNYARPNELLGKLMEEDLTEYSLLINKIYVISQIIDPERVFGEWFVAMDGRSPVPPPPSTLISYTDLKDAARRMKHEFTKLQNAVSECKEEGIEPVLLTTERRTVDVTGIKRRSRGYKSEMTHLHNYEDPVRLGLAILRHSVVKDPEDLTLLLRGYLAYVKMSRALTQQAAQPHRNRLDAIEKEMRNRWKMEVSDETVVSAYVAVFGPENYIGIPRGGKFEFSCFRGGRGAHWFLNELKNPLRAMGVEELDMNMLPGATDDGRSWLLCSLIFWAPGMPDIGKCLMDVARERHLADELLAGGTGKFRFTDISQLTDFNETYHAMTKGYVYYNMLPSGKPALEIAVKVYNYGHDKPANAQREAAADAINEYVRLFNRELQENKRQNINIKEATDIIVHTLTELREGLLSQKGAYPEYNWTLLVGRIWEYLTEPDPTKKGANPRRYKDTVRAAESELEKIVGRRDADGNVMSGHEGCLLEDMKRPGEERQELLENKLLPILDAITKIEPQIAREFLYAEFCANMTLLDFGMPLRSVCLVGAHLHFEGIIRATPTHQLPPDEQQLMKQFKATGSDIAWQRAIDELSRFLDVQGSVTPVTLRRYHLSGVAAGKIDKKTGKRRLQLILSEDAYNEIPKEGEFLFTMLMRRPVLDSDLKRRLRAAAKDGNLDEVIRLFRQSSDEASLSVGEVPDIILNPKALEYIKETRLLFLFPTTLMSNIGSAIIPETIGELIAKNGEALKVWVHNALLENDPPHTTVATMLENLFRLLSDQQRHDSPQANWAKAHDYFSYIILRNPCLYAGLAHTYVAPDREGIKARVGNKVAMVELDIEDPKATQKGRYLGPPLMRAVLQLHQLKNLGIRVSEGRIEAFPGSDMAEAVSLQKQVVSEWDVVNQRASANGVKSGRSADVYDYDGTLAPRNSPMSSKMAEMIAEGIIAGRDHGLLSSKTLEEMRRYKIFSSTPSNAASELRPDKPDFIAEIAKALVSNGLTIDEAWTLIEDRVIFYLGKGGENLYVKRVTDSSGTVTGYKLFGPTPVAMAAADTNIIMKEAVDSYRESLLKALDSAIAECGSAASLLIAIKNKLAVKAVETNIELKELLAEVDSEDVLIRYINNYKVNIHQAPTGGIVKIQIQPFGTDILPGQEQFSYVLRDAMSRHLMERIKALAKLSPALRESIFIEPGGKTSIDITPTGKKSGIRMILAEGYKEVRYFGDEPEGNDKAIFELVGQLPGLTAVAVKDENDAYGVLRTIRELEKGRSSASGTIIQPGIPPDKWAGALVDLSNTLLDKYKAKDLPASFVRVFYRRAIKEAEALEPQYAAQARDLVLIAGQALNIISWIERGVPGAEYFRLTMNPVLMVESPDKPERGPSFLERPGHLIQAPREGKPGAYHRGVEGVAKMGPISETATFDTEQLNRAMSNLWIYAMVHGFEPPNEAIVGMTETGALTTIHETSFLVDIVPGTIQSTSTGPGHPQGLTLDVKYVTAGKGIQYNKFYNERGELVKVFGQYLAEGTWTVALPGAVDSMENLGGLRFNDFSMKVTPEQAQAILRAVAYKDLDINAILAAEPAIKKSSQRVPYYAVRIGAEPRIVRNGGQPNLVWLGGIRPPATDLLVLYRGLDEQKVQDVFRGVVDTWLELPFLKPLDEVPLGDVLEEARRVALSPRASASGVAEELAKRASSSGAAILQYELGKISKRMDALSFTTDERAAVKELLANPRQPIELMPKVADYDWGGSVNLATTPDERPSLVKFLGKYGESLIPGLKDNAQKRYEDALSKAKTEEERQKAEEIKNTIYAAETWYGAHPGKGDMVSIAKIGSHTIGLDRLIQALLGNLLGRSVYNRYVQPIMEKDGFRPTEGNTPLPILFKISQAAKQLSNQAHPNLRWAKILNENKTLRERFGYNDKNEKVEGWFGIDDDGVWIFVGFRDEESFREETPSAEFKAAMIEAGKDKKLYTIFEEKWYTKRLLARLDEARRIDKSLALEKFLRGDPEHNILGDFGKAVSLAEMDASNAEAFLPDVGKAFEERGLSWDSSAKEAKELKLSIRDEAVNIYHNLIHLDKNEFALIQPRVIHAIVYGNYGEIQTASDNTLRAANTTKPLDISNLLKITNFKPGRPLVYSLPSISEDRERRFAIQEETDRFGVSFISLSHGEKHTGEAKNFEMLICLNGGFEVEVNDYKRTFSKGESLLMHPLMGEYTIHAPQTSTQIIKASVPAVRPPIRQVALGVVNDLVKDLKEAKEKGAKILTLCDREVAGALQQAQADFPWWWTLSREISLLLEVDRVIEKEKLESWLNTVEGYNPDRLIVIGSSTTIDTGEYIASQLGIPVIYVPTVLTSNTMYGFKAHVKVGPKGEERITVPTPLPARVVVDLKLLHHFVENMDIRSERGIASDRANRSGAGDVFCMFAALKDWQLAINAGKQVKYQEIFDEHQEILKRLESGAENIRKANVEGLELLEELLYETSMNAIEFGNSQPQSGSEHILSDAVSAVVAEAEDMKPDYLHGEKVVLTTLVMAYLQSNRDMGYVNRLKDIARRLGLYKTPEELGLTRKVIVDALMKAKPRPDKYTWFDTDAAEAMSTKREIAEDAVDLVFYDSDAPAATRSSSSGVAAIEGAREMTTDRNELKDLLNTIAISNTLADNDMIVIAFDIGIEPRIPTAQVAQAGERATKRYLNEHLLNIRGTGAALAATVQNTVANLTNKGFRCHVVTIAGDKTLTAVGDKAFRVNEGAKILNIDNPDNRLIPIIGLYEAAIRIALVPNDREAIWRCLNRIALNPDKMPLAIEDIDALMRTGFIRLLPRIVPISLDEAVKAYNAAQSVLRAL